ncbi:MAG: ferritin [Candidatus Gracilibacteria bacterium]|nr:ferritin [Candidatus Gracilibacteria bacterium]
MLQEDRNTLSNKTQDMKRAIDSLNEELGAIDAYIQRADACSDNELKEILLHNSKEEKEHSAMILEWIRRQDGEFAHELKDNLFMEGKIVKH